jgi:SAM-dependent methyltransferase
MKSRATFANVLRRYMGPGGIGPRDSVLIVGGSLADAKFLVDLGFGDLTLTNLGSQLSSFEAEEVPGIKFKTIDAEEIDLPDRSYDFVFVHESLHHCRSPHRALCEMVRVARRHVVMLEPNDSLLMSTLVRLNFSAPYETAAVIDNDFSSGGVRDSNIPNYLYRWTGREVAKTVAAYAPERPVNVSAYPYWDFNTLPREVDLRTDTRIGMLTGVVGTNRFLTGLRAAQKVLNLVAPLRRQGNKFFACISIVDDLQPWLTRSGGDVEFNRAWPAG